MIPSPIEVSDESANKGKLHLPVDSSLPSIKMKSMKNSLNPISPRPASPKHASKELVKALSLKPAKSPMKKNSGMGLYPAMNLNRATCSSAAKVVRKAESLELDEPKQKTCTYRYCSLHNQAQEPALPVLKCFLSAKRQSVKAQNYLNHKEQSLRSKSNEKKVFPENCEERSLAEVEIEDIVSGINGMMQRDHDDESNQMQESYSVTSFEDYVDKSSELSMDEAENFDEFVHCSSPGIEDFLGPTTFCTSSECRQINREKDEENIPEITVLGHSYEEDENQKSTKRGLQFTAELPNSPKVSLEAQLNMRSEFEQDGNSSEGLASGKIKLTNSENPLAEMTNRPKANQLIAGRTTIQNQENAKEYNPRMPRLLLSKPEPEAEKVNLKHCPMEERRRAEEWMIDYALRNTVTRMAPARKRKVSLLVAAFESVIQQEQKTAVRD